MSHVGATLWADLAKQRAEGGRLRPFSTQLRMGINRAPLLLPRSPLSVFPFPETKLGRDYDWASSQVGPKIAPKL